MSRGANRKEKSLRFFTGIVQESAVERYMSKCQSKNHEQNGRFSHFDSMDLEGEWNA